MLWLPFSGEAEATILEQAVAGIGIENEAAALLLPP